jgi:hypothetical protein
MSIFKGTFNKSIKDQLEVRQKAINDRTPQNLSYMNSRNAWIRLSSSVNTFTGGITDKTTLAELSDDGKYDNKLAKQYVLQGGILNDNKLRAGLGDFSNAYSNKASDGTAYRLGIRPMPGITNIDVKSKGAYGSLREATVNFQCWDIKQLEELELLYMRPGYSVLLEWGWTPFLDNDNKYKTNVEFTDIINTAYTKEELFKLQYAKSADGKYIDENNNKQTITGYQGNYDAMYGTIKNYGWTARMDGGYDCHTSIVSMGEIMESLKVNYSPLNNDIQISTKGLINTNVKPEDPSVTLTPSTYKNLSKSYNQNILAGLFYELWEIGKQVGKKIGGNSDTTGHSFKLIDGKYTSTYEMFRIIINIKGGDNEGGGTGTIGKTDEQIYITLESLVNILNNYVILQDSNNKAKTLTPYSPLSVLESPINNEDIVINNGTGAGYLLALAHPLQVSTDPTVCLIKNQLWGSGFNVNVVAASGSVDPNTGTPVIAYGTKGKDYYNDIWWKELAANISNSRTKVDNSSIAAAINERKKLIEFIQLAVGQNEAAIEELKEIQRRFIEIKASPKANPGNIKIYKEKTLAEYNNFLAVIKEGLTDDDALQAIGYKDAKSKTVKGAELAITAASSDPSAILAKQVATQNKQIQDKKEKGVEGAKLLNMLKLPYFVNNDWQEELGIIGNIYVNLNMLYSLSINKDLAAQDPKEKNDVAVYDFIKNILKKISSATGDVNNLELFIDPIDSVTRIIDINFADRKDNPNSKYENIVEVQVQNLESVVRSYKIESQIFPDQMTTVAIGSQVKGGALGQDNNTLVDFNRGIIDRVVPRKVEPTTPLISPDPNTNLKILIDSLGVLYTLFGNLKSDWLGRDGKFDVDEAGKYQNALKDLINFFKAISTSRTKNKAIIPTKVSLVMDGIGGIVIGNLFKLPPDVLPKGYRGGENGEGHKIGYAVTGLGHSIQNNDWITNVDAQFMILDDPKEGIDGIKIDYSKLTITTTTGQDANTSPGSQSTANTGAGSVSENSQKYPVLVKSEDFKKDYNPTVQNFSKVSTSVSVADSLRKQLDKKYITEKEDQLSSNGDITEDLKSAILTFQNKLKSTAGFDFINTTRPIRITAGNDTYHRTYGDKRNRTTHSRGLAIDIGTREFTQTQIDSIMNLLRSSGFIYVIYHGGSALHIHANISTT